MPTGWGARPAGQSSLLCLSFCVGALPAASSPPSCCFIFNLHSPTCMKNSEESSPSLQHNPRWGIGAAEAQGCSGCLAELPLPVARGCWLWTGMTGVHGSSFLLEGGVCPLGLRLSKQLLGLCCQQFVHLRCSAVCHLLDLWQHSTSLSRVLGDARV